MYPKHLHLAVSLVLLTILLACGGGDDPVDPAGGTVEAAGGLVSLDIPPGALDTEVGISVAHTTSTPSVAGMIAASLPATDHGITIEPDDVGLMVFRK